MMRYKSYKATLKTEYGQYMMVKDTIDGLKLEVGEVQGSGVTLWIVEEIGEDSQTSQAFVWDVANIFYSPKVNGNKLELKKLSSDFTQSLQDLSESNQFWRSDKCDGKCYSLASVTAPKQYLSHSSNKELQISEDETKWICFKEEVLKQG